MVIDKAKKAVRTVLRTVTHPYVMGSVQLAVLAIKIAETVSVIQNESRKIGFGRN